jgi:DNA-binding response OmpR family regulator
MSYVLVAEDDPHIQLMIQRKLELAGYKTRVTANGNEALKMALEDIPSILLLDIMLPGTNGLEVCKLVKEGLGASAPPIIIVSAKGDPGDVRAGEEAGANDYVIKPFSPGELLRRIENLLHR